MAPDHLGVEAWKLWKAGTFEDVPLSVGVVDYTYTHEEINVAFLIFLNDADQTYPGWKETSWHTCESPVQAAAFGRPWKVVSAAFAGATAPSVLAHAQHWTNQVDTRTWRRMRLTSSEGSALVGGLHQETRRR